MFQMNPHSDWTNEQIKKMFFFLILSTKDGDVVFAPAPHKSVARDPSLPWFSGILSHEDLAVVDPTRGRFLLQLRALATRRRQILTDPNLSHEDRCRQADNLALTPYTSTKPSISQKIQSAAGQVRLEDLGLTFQFAPSSKVFGFTDVELRTGGADFEVTIYYYAIFFSHHSVSTVSTLDRLYWQYGIGYTNVLKDSW